MANHHRVRFYAIRLAGLLVVLGLAACAGPPVIPGEGRGGGRVEARTVTPDPAWVAQCERHFKEAVRVCHDLYNCRDSSHYHDDAWRQKCLDQARMQYDNCLKYGGR
jgi:hypothetical protein